jgi:hypothetical protein
MGLHRAGRISVVNGSAIVTGYGTRWLNYIKPGDVFMLDSLLISIASVDDHDQLTLSGSWQGDTRSMVKYCIDQLEITPTLADQQAAAIAKINKEAGKAIVAFVPEWKQRNLTARAAELLYIGASNWTTAESAEWAAIEAIWDQVKAIRGTSNSYTNAVQTADTVTEINQAVADFIADL